MIYSMWLLFLLLNSSVKKEELKNRALRTKNSKIIYSLKCRFFVIIPICKDGYYREGLECKECMEECGKCNNPNNCLICNEEHFMTINGECKSKNLTEGCVGEISSSSGCSSCETNYYLKDRECHQCHNKCSTCTVESECTNCIDEYVLIKGVCVHYTNITNCNSAQDSKCKTCSFWNQPNESGTECKSHSV